jgi:dihydroorotate dehydrogenase (NAD+) catalytic subunit
MSTALVPPNANEFNITAWSRYSFHKDFTWPSPSTAPGCLTLFYHQTDIAENARRCIEAGTDALAVINTVMGMAIAIGSRRPIIGNNQGGLSGPAIKPIALLKVHQVYQIAKPHGILIIGQGGIVSAGDVLEFLIAGAHAVGIGTALFYDPLVCPKINAGIVEYLKRHGFNHVSEPVGTLELNAPSSGICTGVRRGRFYLFLAFQVVK